MAATRYVNTASTPGGDGTTNNTTGTDRAWASMSEALSNVSSPSQDYDVYCCGTAADTSSYNFGGWNSSYIVKFYGDQDWASTLPSTSQYRMERSGSIFTSYNDNAQVHIGWYDIGFYNTKTTSGETVILQPNGFGTFEILIERCWFRGKYSSHSDVDWTKGIKIPSGGFSPILKVKNSTFYDCGTGIQDDIGVSGNFINNNVQACGRGIRNFQNKIRNVVLQDNDTDTFGTISDCQYCLTDAGSLTGSNHQLSKTLTFANKAGLDFHLDSGDTDAMETGVGPSVDGDVPSDDLNGNPRGGVVADIGIEQYSTPGPGITFDAQSSSSGTATPLQWSHTIGSGDNRLLVVGIAIESATTEVTCSSVTYDGESLTKIDEQSVESSSVYMNSSLWYIREANLPSTGAYQISATLSSTPSAVQGGGISLANVDQGTYDASAKNSTTSGDTLSQNITTVKDDSWLVDVIGCGNAGTFTADSGQTERYDLQGGTTATGAGSTKAVASAGSTSSGWTYVSGSNRMSMVVAAFAPYEAPSAKVPIFDHYYRQRRVRQ